MFALSLTVFEILMFQMFDLECLGQGCRVQHSWRYHKVANINLCKSHTMRFYTNCHDFGDIKVVNA